MVRLCELIAYCEIFSSLNGAISLASAAGSGTTGSMKLRLCMSILIAGVVFSSRTNAAEQRNESPAVLSHIPRDPVESSALDEIGYSHRRQILEVKFKNGSIYRYVGVPKSVYHDMLKAPSKTNFYFYNIKGYYRSYHVKPRVKDQPKTT